MRIMGANNCHTAVVGNTQMTETSDDKRIVTPIEDGENRNAQSTNTLLSVPQTSKVPASARSKGGRLKVALQPGRGIMDWVRLTAGKQIASERLPFVTEAELRKHNSADDCWILLENKVYDVTEYLTFHPGGDEQLMRAAGCDGTNLFNRYHAWINHETMLKACFVGYFTGNRNRLPQPHEAWCGDFDWMSRRYDGRSEETAAKLSVLKIRITDTSEGRVYFSCVNWSNLKPENVCVDVIRNTVRVLIRPFGETPLELYWRGIPKLLTSGVFKVSVDSSTIKIQFESNVSMAMFSSLDLLTVEEDPAKQTRQCKISEIRKITHNCYLYEMSLTPNTYLPLPVGHHVRLMIDKEGHLLTRPYTPVLVDANARKISFFIKIYENGVFSRALRKLEIGATLEISDSIGSIDFLSTCAPHLVVMTAGTGITPMLRLLAARKNDPKTSATLLTINATPDDALDDKFYEYCGLQLAKDRIKWYHDENQDHHLNTITMSNFLADVIPKILKEREEDGNSYRYRFLICGPTGFVESAKRLIVTKNPELESNVHNF